MGERYPLAPCLESVSDAERAAIAALLARKIAELPEHMRTLPWRSVDWKAIKALEPKGGWW